MASWFCFDLGLRLGSGVAGFEMKAFGVDFGVGFRTDGDENLGWGECWVLKESYNGHDSRVYFCRGFP